MKAYLDLIGSDEYRLYKEAKQLGMVIEEGHVGDYAYYIKKNEDSLGIRVSARQESNDSLMKLWARLEPRIEGKVYFLLNKDNKKFESFISSKGFNFWHGTYELVYEGQAPEPVDLSIQAYRLEDFDSYIQVLSCFSEVRKACNLQPYDWYYHHQEEAKASFNEHFIKNEIFSTLVDDKIVGVSIVEGQEIELIAVHKDYQGQGYGKKMLLHWMRYLIEEKGHSTIRLGMLASNDKALKLYTGVGFKACAGVRVLEN